MSICDIFGQPQARHVLTAGWAQAGLTPSLATREPAGFSFVPGGLCRDPRRGLRIFLGYQGEACFRCATG